jgi:hypothetical protein
MTDVRTRHAQTSQKPTTDRRGRITISKWLDSGSGFHPYLGAVIFQILSTSRLPYGWAPCASKDGVARSGFGVRSLGFGVL